MTSSLSRFYVRPVAFVDAPFHFDGQCLRLAGGTLWFSAIELIEVRDGRRITQKLVAIADLETALATLASDQADKVRRDITRVTAIRPPLRLGERTLRFDQPQVVGILNVTPDSFSDGGRHDGDIGRACDAGVAMLDAGAHIINDVSALAYDPLALDMVAARNCPVVLMHHQGDPATMQSDPRYDDALIDVYDWIEARIEAAEAAGIDRSRIIVDPGIGFGKTLRHNLQLLNGLALFHGLGCPLLLGASRKRIIGALSNEAPADERLGGSVALALHGAQMGAQLLRVHDVPETVQAIRIWRGLRDEALMPPL